MNRIILAAALSLVSTAFLATDPADAARRKQSTTRVTTTAYADTYYYGKPNNRDQILRDRARPFFGSPVRGKEFFEAQGNGS